EHRFRREEPCHHGHLGGSRRRRGCGEWGGGGRGEGALGSGGSLVHRLAGRAADREGGADERRSHRSSSSSASALRGRSSRAGSSAWRRRFATPAVLASSKLRVVKSQ